MAIPSFAWGSAGSCAKRVLTVSSSCCLQLAEESVISTTDCVHFDLAQICTISTSRDRLMEQAMYVDHTGQHRVMHRAGWRSCTAVARQHRCISGLPQGNKVHCTQAALTVALAVSCLASCSEHRISDECCRRIDSDHIQLLRKWGEQQDIS